jgi:hypothetical protein
MNCVILDVLAILYLDNMDLKANIFLFLLLKHPAITNTIAH